MYTRILVTAVIVLAMNSASLSAAQVLTGKWSGKSPTSLEFLEGKRVTYCYRKKCTTQSYTGDINKKIKFSWGRSRFTFTKTESGYDGTFLRVMTARVKIK